MKEYIERAALIDDFEHCSASKEIIRAIVDRINLHPAADVAEVRYGRWELYGNDDDLGSSYFCSVCHSSFDEDWSYDHNKFRPFKFCPNCGARMGKEDEHETS